MTTTHTTTFDFATLRRAIEERDAEALTALYSPDAEVRLVDHDHPPGSPLVLRVRPRSPTICATPAAGT